MSRAYLIDIEHRETDQVFSYHRDGGMLHFNVTLLARLREQMPHEFERITMDLDQKVYDLCINHRGIEEHRVERLVGKSLREPGYAVLFPDGSFTVVDGHHRIVRRWRGGTRTMDFWVTDQPIWQHCLAEYTPEHEAELMRDIPRVENAETIVSPVTLHPRGR